MGLVGLETQIAPTEPSSLEGVEVDAVLEAALPEFLDARPPAREASRVQALVGVAHVLGHDRQQDPPASAVGIGA